MAFSVVGTPQTFTTSSTAQANTAGNTLFIGIRANGATAATSITDTQFNLWKQMSFVKNGSSYIQLFMCQRALGGANTITINGTISFYLGIYIEVSNDVAGLTVMDSAHATQIGSGTGTNFTTQPIRLTSPATSTGDLVFGLVGNETANSLTISNTGSFTQAGLVLGNTALYYILGDTNTSETFSGTYSSSVSWECLIVSFKRVSIPQGAGTWVDQGVVIAPVSSDQPGQPNVFYEAGPVILSANPDGKIFKILFGTTVGTCYAESADGITWTRYGSNPVIAAGAHDYPRVFKSGSTYYCYTGVLAGPVKAYTASTLNGPWTLQNASAIAISQNWETAANFIGQLCVIGQDGGGTWHGYYAAISDAYFGHNYAMGHATSSDLLTWSKDANNPTLVTCNASQLVNARLINGVYYAWSQIVQPGIPYNTTGSVPNDVGRLSATSPSGPWSLWPTAVSYRTTSAEGVGTNKGQWADPWLVEALGNVYMFTSIAVDGTTAATQIGCAISFSNTVSQLVQTNEGMKSIPLISDAGLAIQLNALASDNFTRANENPIAGNWTQLFTGASFSPGQIASNFYEGSVAGNNSDSYWNANSWPADQWVSFTLNALADSSSFAGVDLRATPGAFATATTYRIFLTGPIGATSKYSVFKYIGGALTQLKSATTLATAVGDVFLASAIASQISLYQNGNLIFTVSDSGITSGVAGILAVPSAGGGVTAAKISAFSGGSNTPFPGGSAAFDIMFRGRLYVTRVVSGL